MYSVEKPWAVESFILTTKDGRKVNMRLELHETGGFHYGNSSVVLMFEDDNYIHSFDTRYEKGCNSPEAFHEWALKCVKGWVRDDITVERN